MKVMIIGGDPENHTALLKLVSETLEDRLVIESLAKVGLTSRNRVVDESHNIVEVRITVSEE